MNEWPSPTLRHLARLTDDVGLVEHARFDTPRRELGYCTDDAGRALAIASRLPSDPAAHRLATVALQFLVRAYEGDGRFRLRLNADGAWGDGSSDDASGRAVLGLGVAAGAASWPKLAASARRVFDDAVTFRSEHPRALGYAVLGASAVADSQPDHPGALELLRDAADLLPRPKTDLAWPWPEHRLTYANALLPEAALATAAALGRQQMAHDALSLLEWLVQEESRGSWFSFTPVNGRGRGDEKPAFDQQPIEAWTMADACARAHRWSGDARWAAATRRAGAWFVGANDIGVPMFDPHTGGGFDGLEGRGVNRNQGAESTLAFVGTMLAVSTLRLQPRRPARNFTPRASGLQLLTGRRGDD